MKNIFLPAASILLFCLSDSSAIDVSNPPQEQASAPKSDAAAPAEHKAASSESKLSPADALERLKTGNKRFVTGKLEHPGQTPRRRSDIATAQHPFAVVLTCSDSRTPPELIFDQGLGDLFVIRVAGNILTDEVIGSMEYAVEHLGASLIVVLGHERCGAVKAARETLAAKGKAPGHIQSLVKALTPAVEATASADAETTAKTNERLAVQELRSSTPILSEFIEGLQIAVLGAHYDLDTGAVEFLKEAKP